MCVTLSSFLGCSVDSVKAGLLPAIDAYVDYLRRADGCGARCAGHNILSSRSGISCPALGSGCCVGSGADWGIQYANADAEVVGASWQGGVCFGADRFQRVSDLGELSRSEGGSCCVGGDNRGCDRPGASRSGSTIETSEFTGAEGQVPSISIAPRSEIIGSANGKAGVSGVGPPRGPNFLRNHAMRMKKRDKKNKDKVVTSSEKPQGFWNSCTEEERKLLISTKARMHAAENLQRAKEAERKASEIGSSFDLVTRVVRMADFAQKQANKDGSGKIYSWAGNVANSSAEDLARSAPSSSPSFSDLDGKHANSSQSSFELELMSKDVEIRVLKEEREAAESRIERLTDEIHDLKLASQMSNNRFSLLSVAKDRLNKQEKNQSGVGFSGKTFDKKPKFVKTPQQPFEYVKYSPLDYE